MLEEFFKTIGVGVVPNAFPRFGKAMVFTAPISAATGLNSSNTEATTSL